MPADLRQIRDFLALKRIALVGLSRDPKDFSRYLFKEMSARGYDMVPVNPAASELEGKPCFARVQDIAPPVDGVLIMTPASNTERIVRDCFEARIHRVWMHRGGGPGAVNREAVKFCYEKNIHLVEGQCPLMFLSHTGFVHRVHGFIQKLTGKYPRELQIPAPSRLI